MGIKKNKSIAALAALAALLVFGVASSVSAATFQLDFDVSFGDPLDPDTAAPAGPAPWLTAIFDDDGTPGSVDLTLTLSSFIEDAEVTKVYLNVDDSIGAENLTITQTATGTGPTATAINHSTDGYKADADGWFDILFDLPIISDTFDAGETLTFSITGAGLVASSFNYLSTPDPVDPNGPFLGAAKFQSTGNGEQSDWVGAVPVPAAVWLFGSGLLGLVGVARRKQS